MALKNMESMESTLLVSMVTGELKEIASANMYCIEVTFLVSNDTVWLKANA